MDGRRRIVYRTSTDVFVFQWADGEEHNMAKTLGALVASGKLNGVDLIRLLARIGVARGHKDTDGEW